MSEFKVGDKVRVRVDAKDYGTVYGRIDNKVVATITSVTNDPDEDEYPFRLEAGSHEEWFRANQIELATTSWETLAVGDIILEEDGDPHRVFGVVGEIVFYGRDETVDGGSWRWNDIAWFKSEGWSIKQDSPTDDTTELSVAEIETKLGVPAGTLRVKKD